MSCPEKIPNHQHCTTHTSIQQSSWVLGVLRSLLQHKPATPQLSCSCVTASTHTMRAICHPLDCIVPHSCCPQCRQVSSCRQPSDFVRRVPIEGDRDSIKNRKGQFNSSQVEHARLKPSFDRHITTVCTSLITETAIAWQLWKSVLCL